jgi:hypothetical protein
MGRGYEPLSTEDWNKLMRANVVARVIPKGMAVPGLGGQDFNGETPIPSPSPTPTPTPLPDTDATAYLNAVVSVGGSVDATMSAATYTLFSELKSNSLWDKLNAFYLFMGGTADSHKFNAKDPRDLDAAYRLTWFGGVSHGVSGSTGNGTNGYADTHLLPSSLTNNDTHLSFYSTTQSNPGVGQTGYPVEIGRDALFDNGVYLEFNLSVWTQIAGQNSVGTMYSDPGQPGQPDGIVSDGTSTSQMFMVISRTNSTTLKMYKNGTLEATETTSNPYDITDMTESVLLWQDGTLAFSRRNSAFASIGDGLTDTDVSNLSSIVNNFQTSLSRNVY